MSERIRISEIFGPTVQGEGPLIGRPTVFVRTGGCDYRCAWCDTLYAVLPQYRDEWALMAAPEILQRVDALSGGRPVLVTISGGNPALQPLGGLIARGKAGGHSFAVETQGSVAPQWFAALEWLIVSPKPPSASVATDWSCVESCINAAGRQTRCALKIVIFDDRDYDFARTAARRFPSLPMYLQVGNPAPLIAIDGGGSERADVDELMRRFRWLVGKVADDRWFEVTVLPQLHVLAWGNRRGV